MGEKEGNASTEVSKSTMDEVLQAVVEKYDAHSTHYVMWPAKFDRVLWSTRCQKPFSES